MIILDTATRSLEILLAAVPTTQLPVVACYADNTSTAFTPATTTATTNSSTAVTIVGSPSGSPLPQRVVKFINVFNADTAAATITIQYNDNGTLQKLVVFTLAAGESLEYSEKGDWYVVGTCGQTRTMNIAESNESFFPYLSTPIAPGAGGLALTSATSYATYLATAERAYANASVNVKVTQSPSGSVVSEIAILKGSVVVAGNPSLTLVNYLDVSSIIISNAMQTLSISLSGIVAGDQLWVCIYASWVSLALGMMNLNYTGDVVTGFFASAASTRPSTMAAPTTFTAINTCPIWAAVKFQ
jgi:hypothetical protein